MMSLLVLLPMSISGLMRALHISRRALHARIRRARKAGFPIVCYGRQPNWTVMILPRRR